MSHCCISMARKCRSARTRWTVLSLPSATTLCGPVNGRRCCPGWAVPATLPPVKVRRRSTPRSRRAAAPSACQRLVGSFAVWTAARWRTRTTSTTTHGCPSLSPSSSSTSSTGPTTCTSKAPAVGVCVCWGVYSDLCVCPFLCHSLPRGFKLLHFSSTHVTREWLTVFMSPKNASFLAVCRIWVSLDFIDICRFLLCLHLDDASTSLCQEYVAFIFRGALDSLKSTTKIGLAVNCSTILWCPKTAN